MKKQFIFPFLIFLAACSSSTSEESSAEALQQAKLDSLKQAQDSVAMLAFVGRWAANWDTPPEAYPEIEDMEFNMTGEFLFTEDSLTVTANGYPGCIFNVDTLAHTQSWFVSNDSLFLVNEPGTIGMTYKVLSRSSDRINLQLMQDIFITLER